MCGAGCGEKCGRCERRIQGSGQRLDGTQRRLRCRRAVQVCGEGVRRRAWRLPEARAGTRTAILLVETLITLSMRCVGVWGSCVGKGCGEGVRGRGGGRDGFEGSPPPCTQLSPSPLFCTPPSSLWWPITQPAATPPCLTALPHLVPHIRQPCLSQLQQLQRHPPASRLLPLIT